MIEKTLDLTCFNRANFDAKLRLRQLADWAFDYENNGVRLAKIKLPRELYLSLIEEIQRDNMLVKLGRDNVKTINFGFGDVEIIYEK